MTPATITDAAPEEREGFGDRRRDALELTPPWTDDAGCRATGMGRYAAPFFDAPSLVPRRCCSFQATTWPLSGTGDLRYGGAPPPRALVASSRGAERKLPSCHASRGNEGYSPDWLRSHRCQPVYQVLAGSRA